MNTFLVQLVVALLCIKICLCQEGGFSFLPEIGDDQDFNFIGLFQIQPAAAETATVPTYALPGSAPNAVPAQQPHPQVPVTQQHPQVPSPSHPVNNQHSVPGATLLKTLPQNYLPNNFAKLPQISNQIQYTPALTYPQVLGVAGSQLPFSCETLLQIMASQNQLGFNGQLSRFIQPAYFPQGLLVPTSYRK